MPRITPSRAALGCANLLTAVGGFGCGVYLGLSKSRGIDAGAETLLKFGPSGLGGFLGFLAGMDIAHDSDALDEITPYNYQVSPEYQEQARDQMKGCCQGCGPIVSTIFGAGVTGLGTLVGFYVGKAFG